MAPWTLSDVVLTSAVILLLHRVCLGIYNVFFHPLASFPGPRLAALTGWWRAYIELYGKENFTTKLVKLHTRYGDVVRIAPNELHFADPVAYHDIYNAKNRWTKYAKLYNALRSADGHASFHLTMYQDAKRRREPMIPLFSRSAILNMQHLLQENLNVLCSILAERHRKGKTSDLLLAMRAFALDTVTSFCFSRPLVNALHAPDFDAPLERVMSLIMTYVPALKHFPVLHWLISNVPPSIACSASPDLKVFYDFRDTMARQVEHAMRHPESLADAPHPTVFHALLDKVNAHRLTFRQLCAEGHLLTFAGTDTASNTLTCGITHVLGSEKIRGALVAELRAAWSDLATPPRYEELEKLPYLRAVVKESLRIGNGVLSPMERITPTEGAVIAGKFIPGGAVVSISNAFVHYSDKIFRDPHVFAPERWLEPGADSLEQWLVSFSKGPRSCLGINLGYCELYLVFANLFRRFDLSLKNVGPEDMVWREFYLPHYHGPSIQLRTEPVVA